MLSSLAILNNDKIKEYIRKYKGGCMTTKQRDNHVDLYEDVEKIKAALMNAANDIGVKTGDVFHDSVDSVKETSGAVKNNVAKYTSKKPFKSLSIALLAGVVIGYLIRK